MSRRLTAVGMAAIMVLSFASTAFAGNINESFSVNSSIAVSGIPATVSYGALDPGQTSSAQHISFTVTANVPWKGTLSGTDFSDGPDTIVKANRFASTDSGPNVAFGTPPINGSASWLSGGADSSSHTLDLTVAVPSGAMPGNYNGQITYTFSAS